MDIPVIGFTGRKLPSQTRSRERVEKILSATAGLLIEVDINEITTSTIAKQADIPVGSVYQYFSERDSVLLALGQRVIENMIQKLQSVFSEVSETAHWRHVVREMLKVYLEIHMQDDLYHRLAKALHNNDEWHRYNITIEQKMVEFLSQYGLLEERGYNEQQIDDTVRLLVMMCSAVVQRIKDLPSKNKADRMLVELQDAVIAYLATKLGD
ncbi:TetR family transcriptional regulator [Sneathiella sp. P13V-1]|uniref:TetR/AcrR family transcriptional regulator n=1 Tax=Sneathiella sp. P13V-1 TaxID=2697366 RepID=UPI00187BBE76|nr:TetR/AcrR family transcriptional regulator [Sneathiella sp. P13V-1]MBE7635328.1 TetR family transcriptional regulator [Sneathiella sp. P13V-1]